MSYFVPYTFISGTKYDHICHIVYCIRPYISLYMFVYNCICFDLVIYGFCPHFSYTIISNHVKLFLHGIIIFGFKNDLNK